jgi:hypothetical protein
MKRKTDTQLGKITAREIIARIIFLGIIFSFLPSSIYIGRIWAQAEKKQKASYKVFYSGNDGGPNWRILSTTIDTNKREGERRLAIDLGPAGTLDSAHAFSQSVIREKNGYVMYYGGYDGANWRILRTISVDGINWIKQGVCLNLGATGSFDSVHILYPYALKDNAVYKMWYAAYDGAHWRIGYAVSGDGVIFGNRQPVLDTGSSGALDSDYVHTPAVIKQGSIYTMYYAGFGGAPKAWRIMRATSVDGINWIKQGLVLDRGSSLEPDSNNLLCGSVIYSQGLYKIWYWGQGNSWRILYAFSKNGIDWEKQGIALDLGPMRSLDFKGLVVPAVVEETGEEAGSKR